MDGGKSRGNKAASLLHPPAARHQVGSTWFQGLLKEMGEVWALEGLLSRDLGCRVRQEGLLRVGSRSCCLVQWAGTGDFPRCVRLHGRRGETFPGGNRPAVPVRLCAWRGNSICATPPASIRRTPPWPRAGAQGEGAAALGVGLFGRTQAGAGGVPCRVFQHTFAAFAFPFTPL